MKSNRKATISRNSDKSQKRKSGNPKTMPEPSAAERTGTEEKLLASETRYRRLFETAKDGILILDGDTGEIVDVNPFLVEMLGYSHAEFLGKQLWEIGLFKDIVASKNSFLKLQEERYIRYENLPLGTKDGHMVWVEFVSNAYDVNGKQVIQCNIRNITDRKQAEEALKKSENDYRYLFEHANDVIIVLEPEQEIILEANAMACKTYGFSHNELVGMSLKKLTKDVARGESHIKDFLDRRPQNNFESVHLDKNGREIHFLINCSLIEYMGKKAILSINRDITERKQAEEALHASETRYRLLVEASPDAVTQTDMTGKILMCNMQTAILHGYEHPDELIGQSALELFSPDELERVSANMQKTLEDGIIRNVEYRLVKKDGSQFPAELSAAVVRDAAGKPVTLMALTHDITKRKQAEEQLLVSQATYEGILNSITEAVYIQDENGVFLDVNLPSEKMYGYARSDFVGRTPEFISAPGKNDLAAIAESVRKAYEGKPQQFEFWGLRKDGSVFPKDVSLTAGTYFGKKVVIAVARDITERKQVEKVVGEERNLLLTLINNLPDRIYVKDIQGRKTISNTADLQTLGEKRMEDVIGKTDFDTYPAELATQYWADDKMVLDSGKPVINREEPNLDWQDNLTWTLTTKVPLRDDNGQIVGLVGIGRDFTERRQMEERLRDNEAMYRLLFDSAQVGILLVDAQGNILEVNQAALQILGSPSAEATKQINLLKYQPLIEAGISADFQKGIDSAQPAIAEYLYTTKWDKSVFITLRFTPLFGANGNLERIQIIMEDTTERKQAEEKIQHQLKRLSALRDIDLVINSNFDLQVALNILLGHVTAQLGVDAAAVLLVKQGMNELEYLAGRGFHRANITRLRLKLGEGYPGRAALEHRTIAINNLAKSQEPFDTKFIEGEGFAAFFAVPLVTKGKVKGVLEVFHRSPLKPDADWLNFLEALAGQAAIAIDNSELFGNLQQSNRELQLAYDKTIEGWSRALDLRDKETEGHTQRVTKAALRLAKAMGLGNDDLIQVRRGALLHDIGKIGVPDHILLKPGDLTEEESAAMRKHPQFAFDLFSYIDFLRPALDIPYCHHEKWDGTGYPRGLKGEQIPLTARIFAVVDVYDAVTSDRPYRVAWTEEKALEYIQSQAGKYFDPNVAQKFIEMINKD